MIAGGWLNGQQNTETTIKVALTSLLLHNLHAHSISYKRDNTIDILGLVFLLSSSLFDCLFKNFSMCFMFTLVMNVPHTHEVHVDIKHITRLVTIPNENRKVGKGGDTHLAVIDVSIWRSMQG